MAGQLVLTAGGKKKNTRYIYILTTAASAIFYYGTAAVIYQGLQPVLRPQTAMIVAMSSCENNDNLRQILIDSSSSSR